MASLLVFGAASSEAIGPGVRRLEEIIVSAQKRAESAQTTPISLASFNTGDLEKLGISNISDLGALVPNFLVDQFPSSNQTLRLFIRGIGIDDVQITQDPAVGVYLNGVYLSRSTGLASDVADAAKVLADNLALSSLNSYKAITASKSFLLAAY